LAKRQRIADPERCAPATAGSTFAAVNDDQLAGDIGGRFVHNPGSVDKTTAPAGISFFFGAILLLATAGDIGI